MKNLSLRRKREVFVRNVNRVIAKFFYPGNDERIRSLIDRILKIPEKKTSDLVESILSDFSSRHHNISEIMLKNFGKVSRHIPCPEKLGTNKKMLIGAYFTHEYSVESAALFNPSIVPHPDQSDLSSDSVRIIMSFRATGEGHISSIVFRDGIIDYKNNVKMNPVSPYIETPKNSLDPVYDKHTFLLKLDDIGACGETTDLLFSALPDRFPLSELRNRIDEESLQREDDLVFKEIRNVINWVAESNYEESFREESVLSERVIFPISHIEQHGIEDARFVKFTDDDGTVTYYATYTAFSGQNILPMLLKTKDFLSFKIRTLNGKSAQNKGMALFPRKIKGKYLMISRIDGENLYIMKSDNINFWHEAKKLYSPTYSWEMVQSGNCGSPIETDAGWLLLTHGVGPMRKYSIGCLLLDKDDPSKVIGKLEDPLITPLESEREGYVPNVVYTCGAIVHNDVLIVPYAMSDITTGIATIELKTLLNNFTRI